MLAVALLLAGCGKKGDAGQAQAGGPGGGPGGAGEAPVPVAVALVGSGEIASYYTATATLAAEKEATILSRVSGVVQKLWCEEGDVVQEGAELLLVDNDEYRYRYEQAQSARMDLEARVARLEQMREQELVSPEEFETLSNNLAAAQAAEGMAELNLSYTRVTAPFTGRVVARSVDVGQNINVGTQLFVLSDFTPLLARVHVPAKEFNKLQADQPVDLTLESNGTRLRGRIKLVSPVIDPSSGTIKVTIEIPTYPPGVRPGDFAQVSIVTERRVNRTLVPKVALVNDRGEQVVYVSADSTAERRVVEIGFQDDRNAEILTGVTEGERVVVKGQRTLKNGAAIKILDNTEAAQVTDSAVTRDGS
ncbi:MAG: efflux RND transporter periplasmic adaptor subunit [Candidatus Krumholzibacteria bacterium]|nr:efflux RND transporter periplasmic adaptor subunit [Candidatus Krumholzibacteria bacterium]MDH4336575.1 efflux RND transporter periplasmic adaptor subunit [Candidatus Krumholzibacteria bacterium]MDH5271020.1 efflux RND transporter periplasmic adaptor subunit [Candidatus Krumholzibacteria bacterium]